MEIVWSIFIVLHVIMFIYLIELFRKLSIRTREYPLEEKPETLPFGFIRLRYVVISYIISYVLWVLLSIWLFNIFVLNYTQ